MLMIMKVYFNPFLFKIFDRLFSTAVLSCRIIYKFFDKIVNKRDFLKFLYVITGIENWLHQQKNLMHDFLFSILQLVMKVLNPLSQDNKEGEKEKDRILFSSWWTNLQRYVANLDRTQCKVRELNLACPHSLGST